MVQVDLTDTAPNVLPFGLKSRWIVTVEGERHFVKVRHRTRWFAVARRHGHDERRNWCASRQDALAIAEMMREGYEKQELAERDPAYQRFRAWYLQQSEEFKVELYNWLIAPTSR